MSRTYLCLSIVVGLLTTSALVPPLGADNGTASGRSVGRFGHQGKIDRVDVNASEIVVNDRRFVLSPSLRVYGQTGALASSDALRHGVSIGFNAAKQANVFQISEIWIMPSNR